LVESSRVKGHTPFVTPDLEKGVTVDAMDRLAKRLDQKSA
jgi:hypothetical protein